MAVDVLRAMVSTMTASTDVSRSRSSIWVWRLASGTAASSSVLCVRAHIAVTRAREASFSSAGRCDLCQIKPGPITPIRIVTAASPSGSEYIRPTEIASRGTLDLGQRVRFSLPDRYTRATIRPVRT